MLTWMVAVVLSQSGSATIKQMGVADNPNNAYLDYIRAADLLREGRFDLYEQAISDPKFVTRLIAAAEQPAPPGRDQSKEADLEDETPDRAALAVLRTLVGRNPLEIRRLAANRFRGVTQLIEGARSKPLVSPRLGKKIELTTPFPELASFRSLNRFQRYISIDLNYAEGKSTLAGQAMVDSFRIASAADLNETLIGFLVGRSLRAIVLADIDRHAGRMSLPEIAALTGFLIGFDPAAGLKRAFKGERQYALDSVEMMLTDPAFFEGADEDLPKEFAKLSASRKAAVVRELQKRIVASYDEVDAVLDKPLRDWVAFASRPEEPEVPASIQSLEDRLGETLAPVVGSAVKIGILEVVQFRLLRVTFEILRYRWNFDRLPLALADLGAHELIEDELTGKPYSFRVTGNTFELSGKGHASQGDITLRFRRLPGAGPIDP